MNTPTTSEILAEIRSLRAVENERQNQTIEWRKTHDQRHATLEDRLMVLEETAAQGRGALGLFLKLGTIVTTFTLLGSALYSSMSHKG